MNNHTGFLILMWTHSNTFCKCAVRPNCRIETTTLWYTDIHSLNSSVAVVSDILQSCKLSQFGRYSDIGFCFFSSVCVSPYLKGYGLHISYNQLQEMQWNAFFLAENGYNLICQLCMWRKIICNYKLFYIAVCIFNTLFSLQYGPHFMKAAKHHLSNEDAKAYSSAN